MIDARSFAAPRAGGEPAKIIRSPRLRNIRSGNQGPGRNSKSAASKAGRKKKPFQSKRDEKQDEAHGEELSDEAIDEFKREQAMKARPNPVRYDPQEIDFSTLKETWPSLPTDANARSVTVFEKLLSMSGRFPNGYVPPQEFGRRVWKGQRVLFFDEKEKSEALEEVKRLAQARADRVSQRKGDLVEPHEVKFNPINAEDTKALVNTFAQGKYHTKVEKNQPGVLGDVTRNLGHNQTYQMAGKTHQFMAKVESLVAASTKRS
ncbi:hypothetical protein NUU61_007095 [Penicillium alfredii]|uniref:Uncharacterized protein n=1 Tax=Penicillium alfredii TaxID=1506179 RepID=A0A9W9F255_9EURO|nr:uncharacterized protein NUU61_007095 [Penicillium alfredii]KAJ5092225.1 hypothetical protein NUU61_007095 [Penicillium alfredii]